MKVGGGLDTCVQHAAHSILYYLWASSQRVCGAQPPPLNTVICKLSESFCKCWQIQWYTLKLLQLALKRKGWVLQALQETLATLQAAALAARKFNAHRSSMAFSDSKAWEVITTPGWYQFWQSFTFCTNSPELHKKMFQCTVNVTHSRWSSGTNSRPGTMHAAPQLATDRETNCMANWVGPLPFWLRSRFYCYPSLFAVVSYLACSTTSEAARLEKF